MDLTCALRDSIVNNVSISFFCLCSCLIPLFTVMGVEISYDVVDKVVCDVSKPAVYLPCQVSDIIDAPFRKSLIGVFILIYT